MTGMLGSDLIKETQAFLKSFNVSEICMPRFAFKATFWDLPAEQIDEIFKLGIKAEDVIEKLEQP